MAAVRVTTRERITTCVACDKDIEGDYTVEVPASAGLHHDGVDHKKAHLVGNIVGIKVDHDCMPGVKRGPGRPRGSVAKPKPVDAPEGLVVAPEDHREALKGRAVRDNPQA